MTVSSLPSADHFLRATRVRVCVIATIAILLAAASAVTVAKLANYHRPAAALLLPVVAVPVLIWRWPRFGVYLFMFAAVFIEQNSYTVVPGVNGAITSRITFFRSITPGQGVTPADMFLLLAFLAWLMYAVREGDPLLPRSPLTKVLFAYTGLFCIYFVYGLVNGGHYKISLFEIRPWLYMSVMYLIAASTMTTRRALQTICWIIVLGSSIKAVYGIYLWHHVRHVQPPAQAVLAHEESFFFGLYLILTIALWVFEMPGRLRKVATALLPVVFMGDMVNSRRTAWAILGIGFIVFLIVSYVRLPHRRRFLNRAAFITLAIAPIYLPLYWNKDGTAAQPARAIHSQIKPDARDKSSDQYRVVENKDLAINIKDSHDVGTGLGVPINYQIPIVNLEAIDDTIDYIPHDGVLYIWMRTGILGEVIFWLLISTALIRASTLVKVEDRQSAMFGAIIAAAIVGYVIMGYEDMGFYWYRMAVAMGILLGVVEARLAAARSGPNQLAGHLLLEGSLVA